MSQLTTIQEATTQNPNKMLWEKGDFTRIASSNRQSGEAFAQSLGITKGMRVLDLGCGDGSTAIPEAQLGAEVLGVDIATNLVAAGNRRAEALGLTNCHFQEGDACNLHALSDESFDLTVSMFGAMFAPKPYDAAKEMVRVTRKGGKIVMGNWIPGDPTLVSQIFRVTSGLMPPPPAGFVSPMTWGIEGHVTDRFAQAGITVENVSFAKDAFTFHYEGTPSGYLDQLRNYFGPMMNAFEAAEKMGRAQELQQELEALVAHCNQSTSEGITIIPATFLRVTVLV